MSKSSESRGNTIEAILGNPFWTSFDTYSNKLTKLRRCCNQVKKVWSQNIPIGFPAEFRSFRDLVLQKNSKIYDTTNLKGEWYWSLAIPFEKYITSHGPGILCEGR